MSRTENGRFCGLVVGAIAFSLLSPMALAVECAVASDRPSATVLSQHDSPPPDVDSQSPDGNAGQLDDSSRVQVPGTSLSMVPPAGFILSEQFSGFIDEETFSSITLTELPAEAYTEISSALSSTPEEISELFAERGIVLTVEQVSSIALDGVQVPFIAGVQTVADTQVKKYFALLGEESTMLLTFNLFDNSQLGERAVIESIQSVELTAAPSIQQKIAELPFTFETAAPFEVFDVLLGSTALLTPNGEVAPDRDVPIVAIATSVSPVRGTTDLAAYSTYLLNNSQEFAGATVIEQSHIEFAGRDGYFTRATLPKGDVILQYFAIRSDNFYIRMIAVGGSEEIEQLMPALEAIQSSVVIED